MAKNSIRDYDATSGNNTDVQSVDISEGCAASGINNALREIMADLKDVSTGAVNLETPAADRLDVDNIRIDGNTISSTDTNGDITLDPNGTGDTIMTGSGGQVTIDENGHITSKQSLDAATAGGRLIGASNRGTVGQIDIAQTTSSADGGHMRFMTCASGSTNPTERMQINSSGDICIGNSVANTVSGYSNQPGGGFVASDSHFEFATTSNRAAVEIGKNNANDGQLIAFRKQGTTVGSIGSRSSNNISIVFRTEAAVDGCGLSGSSTSTGAIIPTDGNGDAIDDHIDLGGSATRFDSIRATDGTIQTSDQNEKQDIASLTTVEITAAKAISKLFKTFKWKSKVAAKGDAARTHSGVIAQEVQAAMSDAGLDASKYAFWCSDTWWEIEETYTNDDGEERTRINTYETADDAPEGATQRTRLGVRYPELLAFIGAATEQRLADIETRLTALEA